METPTVGSTRSNWLVRALAIMMVTWGFALQSYVPIHQTSEAQIANVSASAFAVAPTAATPTFTNDAALTEASLLSDSQMAQTIGAGWWSSLWEGIKNNWDEILWAGVLVLVAVLCNNGELGCYAS